MSEPRRHVTKFTPAAQRDLRGIPLSDARKILLKLGELQKAMDAEDTGALDIKALQGHPGALRLRAGDYRVVYTVEDGQLIIWVLAAGNRRDIYRNL